MYQDICTAVILRGHTGHGSDTAKTVAEATASEAEEEAATAVEADAVELGENDK